MAMRIGSEYRVTAITQRHWRAFADQNRLNAAVVVARVNELAGQLPAAFRTAAADKDVAALGSELPDRLADRIAEQVKRCQAALDQV